MKQTTTRLVAPGTALRHRQGCLVPTGMIALFTPIVLIENRRPWYETGRANWPVI